MIWKQPQWHIPPLFSENTEKSIAAWENGRREELLAKLLGGLSNIPGGLVGVLSAVPRKFVGTLDAIKNAKEAA